MCIRDREHIAHLLHDKSKRAGKPFVAVDCGSLSKELAPSAFFGHSLTFVRLTMLAGRMW